MSWFSLFASPHKQTLVIHGSLFFVQSSVLKRSKIKSPKDRDSFDWWWHNTLTPQQVCGLYQWHNELKRVKTHLECKGSLQRFPTALKLLEPHIFGHIVRTFSPSRSSANGFLQGWFHPALRVQSPAKVTQRLCGEAKDLFLAGAGHLAEVFTL